ncbi:hypothetical protein LMANV2_580017 [Leptospira interrogans serovar Manilae]|uniref:Uncharacterized protein n=1 Tax=Leptospira interrogans serovar Manilae TaxID=214675 RepID=A0AAQ1NZN7_LEPIR|nr:hypothetical protein LMANV2_580017 [Leptospira interrogans serovar Manilae]
MVVIGIFEKTMMEIGETTLIVHFNITEIDGELIFLETLIYFVS